MHELKDLFLKFVKGMRHETRSGRKKYAPIKEKKSFCTITVQYYYNVRVNPLEVSFLFVGGYNILC